jgi:hypothetical protein
MVRSKYVQEPVQTPDGEWLGAQAMPIQWVCNGCDQHVCFNCALTIPGSVPTRLYDETFCSEDCRGAVILFRRELEALHVRRREVLRWKRLGDPRFDPSVLVALREAIDALCAPLVEREEKHRAKTRALFDQVEQTLAELKRAIG